MGLNKYTSAAVAAPAGDALQGTTGEWIIEDSWLDSAGDPSPIPKYGAG